MTVNVTVRVTGWVQAMEKLDRISEDINRPTKGLAYATRRVGRVWDSNFTSEGKAVGGWVPLAEKTVNLREYYGFGGDHPILNRSGALRDTATRFFAEMPVSRIWATATEADSYSDQITVGSYRADGNTAHLRLQGWKASNQEGFTANGMTVPARPFWFTDQTAQDAARHGVMDWLKQEVLS